MDKINTMNERWDYLIILDACRYDYFERAYSKYLQGRLEKRISPGSSTNQWRDESFPDFYDDVVYITANPQINATSKVYGYCAGDHFHKVYEVWKDGWDCGTVRPETVTSAALDIIAKTPGKRVIIHYIQPHAPYLSLGDDARGYANADVNTPRTLVGVDSEAVGLLKKGLFGCLMGLFKWNRLLGNHPDWVLRKLLSIPPKAPMEIVLRNYTVDELREAYRANLDLVLEQAAILVRHLAGRIVVTSDHGELLGEDRSFSHPTNSEHSILREVPWLVIEKESQTPRRENQTAMPAEESTGEKNTEDEQAELAEKLKSLGYFD